MAAREGKRAFICISSSSEEEEEEDDEEQVEDSEDNDYDDDDEQKVEDDEDHNEVDDESLCNKVIRFLKGFSFSFWCREIFHFHSQVATIRNYVHDYINWSSEFEFSLLD